MPERNTVRAAFRDARGIHERAAKRLGIPRSTLQSWLRGPLSDMKAFVDELRAKHAPRGAGRPWTVDETRTRGAVARAWRKSGYRLSVAARALDLPRTSMRHLVHRYGLPNLPAPGRQAGG